MDFLNFFGKTLSGRNLDSCMMYIGKYLAQQSQIDEYFDLNHAILALQQNYGFVTQDKVNLFVAECSRFYELQSNRQIDEINKSAFKKFKKDASNGLTVNNLSEQNLNELVSNLNTLTC